MHDEEGAYERHNDSTMLYLTKEEEELCLKSEREMEERSTGTGEEEKCLEFSTFDQNWCFYSPWINNIGL